MSFPHISPNEDFYHPDDGLKQCRRCFRRLETSEFNRQAARADGLYTYCKDCFRAYRFERNEQKRRDDFARMVNKASLSKKDRVAVEWARKIINRFGGSEKSAEFVHLAVTEAADSSTPRRSVVELFHLVYRIILFEEQQLNEMRRYRMEAGMMTDEQIVDELSDESNS